MSVIHASHPTSAPYTLTNLYGETFTYEPISADEAADDYSEDD